MRNCTCLGGARGGTPGREAEVGSCDPECVRSRRQPGQSRPTDPGEETRRTGSSLWSAREGQPGGESVEGPLGVGRDRVTWQRDPRGSGVGNLVRKTGERQVAGEEEDCLYGRGSCRVTRWVPVPEI